ncbi:hypothetical protein JCM10908_003849 [Rhodotorula pacifica]|uniref:Bst1p n=1 Tax=Rhodotorula pacifica TaxID=1495444 RepID=UPI0031809F28
MSTRRRINPQPAPADTSPQTGSPRLRMSKLLLVYAAAGVAICLAIYRAYTTAQPVYPPGSLIEGARGGGAGSCRMSYMSPSYLHLSGFGREFTRLGNGPWGLYLYREAGWDEDPYVDDGQGGHKLQLTGTPVLFVPGNAGSFRQVRSLASAASRAWYEAPGVKRRGSRAHEGGAHLDFFTIDFNDDFSAFHGQTLLDQAEYTADCIRYILSLYAHHEDEASGRKRPDPLSVIVVGHSMGGVVARAAFLSQNYQPFSISTLVTLATPHVVPPVTVDAGVDRVYAAINSYWRQAYDLPDPSFVPPTKAVPVSASLANFRALPHEELRNLVLVSIAGGISDVTIASESVSLASLVPVDGSNGFTVFTTAVPGVQTPIDHLAILWCQQLMQVVAEGLLAIVDIRRPQGVTVRSDRVRELGSRWIGGLELPPAARQPEKSRRLVALDELESNLSKLVHLERGERLVHRPKSSATGRAVYRLPIPASRISSGPRVFSMLSSATVGRRKQDNVEVWICNNALGSEDEPAPGSCSMVHAQHTTLLPSSPHSSVSPILPAPVEDGAMSYVRLETGDLEDKSAVVVIVKDRTTDWVLAEFADTVQQTHKIEHGALHLLLNGAKIAAFPSTPSLVSEIWLPALDTSLLALKLHVYRSACQEHSTQFAPLVRQHSSTVHESKFFPNARLASLYTHASGPYVPQAASPFVSSGARLQFFLDPSCARAPEDQEQHDLAIEIHVDVRGTLGALAVRFRMALVTIPFALVMLVVGLQIREYNSGRAFPSFGETLSLFVRRYLPALLVALLGAAYLQSIALSTHAALDDSHARLSGGHFASRNDQRSVPSPWLANLLLGTPGSFWTPLAPLLAFALVGVVTCEYAVLAGLVILSSAAVRWLQRNGTPGVQAFFRIAETPDTLPMQRVMTLALLLLVVVFFAPYQFAFLVMVLVHYCSTVRALILATEDSKASAQPEGPTLASASSAKRAWDRYHYTFSILFILVLLSPINALILVVWVRNLAVGWLAPFSSDHNVFLILGFLANVEALHSGKLIQRNERRSLFSFVTAAAFILPAAHAFLYGIRSAHRLYSLANLSFGWLAFSTTETYLELQRRLSDKLPAVLVSDSLTLVKRRLSEPPQLSSVSEPDTMPKPTSAQAGDATRKAEGSGPGR